MCSHFELIASNFRVFGQFLGYVTALGAGLRTEVVHPSAVVSIDAGANLDGVDQLRSTALDFMPLS
jgi:hypothetical protein